MGCIGAEKETLNPWKKKKGGFFVTKGVVLYCYFEMVGKDYVNVKSWADFCLVSREERAKGWGYVSRIIPMLALS